MCPLELGARLDSQLAPEEGGVVAVDADRARTISRQRHHPHQLAAGLLVGGLVLEEALEMTESGGVLASGLEELGEPRERAPVVPPQPLTLALDPGVVAAGEQLPAVERHGPLQRRALLRLSPGRRCLGHRGLEGGDVEIEGRVTAPAGGPRVGEEEALRLGQRVAQLVENLPEVVARLCLARVRPEGEGQVLAKLRRVAVEEQVAEERVQPWRMDGGHRLVSVHEAESAEEADVQGRLRAHGRAPYRRPAPRSPGGDATLRRSSDPGPALRPRRPVRRADPRPHRPPSRWHARQLAAGERARLRRGPAPRSPRSPSGPSGWATTSPGVGPSRSWTPSGASSSRCGWRTPSWAAASAGPCSST